MNVPSRSLHNAISRDRSQDRSGSRSRSRPRHSPPPGVKSRSPAKSPNLSLTRGGRGGTQERSRQATVKASHMKSVDRSSSRTRGTRDTRGGRGGSSVSRRRPSPTASSTLTRVREENGASSRKRPGAEGGGEEEGGGGERGAQRQQPQDSHSDHEDGLQVTVNKDGLQMSIQKNAVLSAFACSSAICFWPDTMIKHQKFTLLHLPVMLARPYHPNHYPNR